jgi:hypothetical protein
MYQPDMAAVTAVAKHEKNCVAGQCIASISSKEPMVVSQRSVIIAGMKLAAITTLRIKKKEAFICTVDGV